MEATMDCIFCRLLADELPASFVHRGPLVFVLMDIQPVNAGHLLVVPNQHVALLGDLPEDAATEMFRMGHRCVAALRRSGLPCEGVNLFLADGEAAMQEIPHVHLHVFPRFAGDGFGLKFPQRYFEKPSRSGLDSCAEKIRDALNGLSG
jgi:histidine triad (HIT) family protein